MTTYKQRDDNLKALGFQSYKEYLNSDLWDGIRKSVLKRYNRRCIACGGTAKQVHHRSYEVDVLAGHNTKPLIPICKECHKHIEFTDGEKLTTVDADNKLKSTLRPKWERLVRKKAKVRHRRRPHCIRFKR